jgi:hypothetical protein
METVFAKVPKLLAMPQLIVSLTINCGMVFTVYALMLLVATYLDQLEVEEVEGLFSHKLTCPVVMLRSLLSLEFLKIFF